MSKIIPLSYRQLIKIFVKENFIYQRTKGDHMILTKTGVSRPLVIPKYKEVPVFVIKNLLRTAGISREQFFELIDDVN